MKSTRILGALSALLLLSAAGLASAQTKPFFRLVVATGLEGGTQFGIGANAISGEGLPDGFAGQPAGLNIKELDLRAAHPEAKSIARPATVEPGTLYTFIAYQDVKRDDEGEVIERKLGIHPISKNYKGKPNIEVISFSEKKTVSIELGGKTLLLKRGVGQKLDRKALKELLIKHEGETLYEESAAGEYQIVIAVYDGPDGKLRVTVADA